MYAQKYSLPVLIQNALNECFQNNAKFLTNSKKGRLRASGGGVPGPWWFDQYKKMCVFPNCKVKI